MRIAIDPGSVEVSPGGKVSAVIGVRNTGAVADTFFLTVDGIAADWCALGATSLTLKPGAEETTSLVIQPPAGEKTPAGAYKGSVQLTSHEDPTQQTSAPLTVVVLSAGSVTMALSPLQAQGRQAFFQATFANRSNADATMVLTADDDENALTFKMRPDDTVDVPSGENATITVRVRPEIRRLVGQPRAFTFSLTGAPENNPFPTKMDAALAARARFTYIPRWQSFSLPNWLWYPLQLIFKLLLILAALAFIFFLLDAIATGGTPKHAAQPTEVAELQATILAATKTPGNGKAAATAGVQLTAIAQGTTVLLAATGPVDIGSITATATITPTGKAGSSKGGTVAAKSTKPPAAPTPNITQFTLIPSGSYVAATWQVDGATEVQLNGQTVPINGAIQVPAGAAVALLQAFNGKSVAQQALPVPTLSAPPAGGVASTSGDGAAGGASGGSAAGGTTGSSGSTAAGGTTGSSGSAAGGTTGSTDAAGGAGGVAATVASDTPAPTSTPLPTATPYPTSTTLPTPLPTSTPPPAAMPTNTVIPPKPPAPPTAVNTATASPTVSSTATASASATSTSTPTDTATASPTASPSASPSHTASPTSTMTNTATAIPPTSTATATASATDTASATPTRPPDTATTTRTATRTVTKARIPTVTVVGTTPLTGTGTISSTDVLSGTGTALSLPASDSAPAAASPPAVTTAPAIKPTATNTPTPAP